MVQTDVVLLPSSSTEVVQGALHDDEGGDEPGVQSDVVLPPSSSIEVDQPTQHGEDHQPLSSAMTSSSADSDEVFIIDRKEHFQE
eukprot:2516033-Amphidinium_carterae.1